MRFGTPLEEYRDPRGRLVTLFNDGCWVEANYIESRAGIVRGNHYHQRTREMVFMLDGEVDIQLVNVRTGQKKQVRLTPGQVIRIEPFEAHAFRTRTAGRWLNFLSIAFDAGNPDCTRFDVDVGDR